MIRDFILVAGYGWSGSSAVVDLLKEYDGIVEPDVEFRLIKDPYGLENLRHQIVHNWDALTVDTAIKDFLWYASCLNSPSQGSRFSLSVRGLDYGKKIGSHFLVETYNFVNEITSYSYQSEWWMPYFKMSKSEIFRRKVQNLFHIHQRIPKMYFAYCTDSHFDSAAKKYIASLWGNVKDKRIVLDQAIPAQNPEVLLHYFQDAKMLIVDRDPRDIYVDLINGKNLLGLELSKSHDVNKYILWHKSYRRRVDYIKSLPYVKVLQFEELVRNYDRSVNEIEGFLGLSKKKHILGRLLFNPSDSEKNIEIWKSYPHKGELETIERELSDYIFS